MKWGVRRYQNQDGTYTELGKKFKRIKNNVFKKKNKKKTTKPKGEETVGKKLNKKLNPFYKKTDEELKAEIARMELEKKYKDLQNYLHPKKEHKVRKFIGELFSTTVKTAYQKGLESSLKAYFEPEKKETAIQELARLNAEEQLIEARKKRDERLAAERAEEQAEAAARQYERQQAAQARQAEAQARREASQARRDEERRRRDAERAYADLFDEAARREEERKRREEERRRLYGL